jgi:hypothetical protein
MLVVLNVPGRLLTAPNAFFKCPSYMAVVCFAQKANTLIIGGRVINVPSAVLPAHQKRLVPDATPAIHL